MMLESDGNLETYTEFECCMRWICMNQIQTRCGQVTWSGYPSQSCTRPEKEVKKLQQFETYEEIPLAEAEGQEFIS